MNISHPEKVKGQISASNTLMMIKIKCPCELINDYQKIGGYYVSEKVHVISSLMRLQ